MPSKSQKQHDMMELVAKSKKFAEKMGISQKVAKEFLEADRKEGLWQDSEDKDEDKGSSDS